MIQADTANNALIIMAPEPVYNNLRAVIERLDTRRAQVFVEALKRAGPQLTQAGFIKALESLKNYETALTLPTTFGPGIREGNQAAKVVEIEGDLSRKMLPEVVRATEGGAK